MFLLARKLRLEPDPKSCWFSARIHFAAPDGRTELIWYLRLHSQSNSEFYPDLDPISIGIGFLRLTLNVSDWHELFASTFVLDGDDELKDAFLFVFQWEPLLNVRLSFEPAQGAQIGVTAEGTGELEAAPEVFAGRVDFRIDTPVEFSGVFVDVPLTVQEPIAYASSRLKFYLPGYPVRETAVVDQHNEGVLLARAVQFHPGPLDSAKKN